MGGALAQDLGEDQIGRRHPHPRVDHEKADVGHVHRAFSEPPHPALQAVVGDLLEASRVDHREAQIGKPCRALAQVARHPGLVVDECQPLADQPVEQGGFAHIGPPHDGEGK